MPLPRRSASDAESEMWEPCSRPSTTEQTRLSAMPTDIDPAMKQKLLEVPEQELRMFLQTHLREAQQKVQASSSLPWPSPKEFAVPAEEAWYKGSGSVIEHTRERSDIDRRPVLAVMSTYMEPDAAEHSSYSVKTSREFPPTSSPDPTPRSLVPTTVPLTHSYSDYGSVSDGKMYYRKNTKGLLLGDEGQHSGGHDPIMDSEETSDLPLNATPEESKRMELDPPLLRVSRPVAACSRCQAVKIKCDGKLPACTACESSNKADECSNVDRALSDATVMTLPPAPSYYQSVSPIQEASSLPPAPSYYQDAAYMYEASPLSKHAHDPQTHEITPVTKALVRYGSLRGQPTPLTEEQKQNAHEMRSIGACLNCKELREKVRTARIHRKLVTNTRQCNHGIPCSTCIERYAQIESLPNEDCRGRKIVEHSRSVTAGADNNGPPSNLRGPIYEAPASGSDDATDSYSPIDVDMDMVGEAAMTPQEQGRRRLRSAKKRDVLRTNSNSGVRQSPPVKPAGRKVPVFSKAPPKEVTESMEEEQAFSFEMDVSAMEGMFPYNPHDEHQAVVKSHQETIQIPPPTSDSREMHGDPHRLSDPQLPGYSSSSGYTIPVVHNNYESIPRTEETFPSSDEPVPNFGLADAVSSPVFSINCAPPLPQAVLKKGPQSYPQNYNLQAPRRDICYLSPTSASLLWNGQGPSRLHITVPSPPQQENFQNSEPKLPHASARHSIFTPTDDSQSMRAAHWSSSRYDSRRIDERSLLSSDEDEREEGCVQSRERKRSGWLSETLRSESQRMDEGFVVSNTADERDDQRRKRGRSSSSSSMWGLDFDDESEVEVECIQSGKRRKLVGEEEDPVDSEYLSLTEDRDIVDVLLEQWTVPVY
jgi:hypothetical protein